MTVIVEEEALQGYQGYRGPAESMAAPASEDERENLVTPAHLASVAVRDLR